MKHQHLFCCVFALILGVNLTLKAQVKGNVRNDYQTSQWDNRAIQQGNQYNETLRLGIDNNLVQNGWTSPFNDNTLFFQVNALMNVEAESYLAIFNITQLGANASEADTLLNEKIYGFINLLKGLGITSKDVSTDIISLKPLYEFSEEKKFFSKTYTEVPSGFELQKNIHVRYTNPDWLDPILTLAAANEIYDLVKVDYVIKDIEGIYDQLRKKSIANLKKKLVDFKELQVDLDTVYHVVSEDRSLVYPLDRYKTYQSFQSTALQKGRRDEVTRIRKPVTYYYDKLPYHNFDIIVNPEYLDPVVQVTYSLKVKYIVKEPAKKVEKEFILVTPEGVVKTLKVE